MIIFRQFVILAGLLVTGSAVAAEAPPNVVLIMADDLGVECLSTFGSTSYSTPRLDALAASGAKFTQCFAQPLCTPSRVQIMTGKYNFRNYVEFGYLPPDEKTFGDLFRDAGYRTCVAGKWQLSGQGVQYPEKTDPADWGFDEHCLWQLNNRAPYGNRGPRYWKPYLERNGEVVTVSDQAYGPDVVNYFVLDFIKRNRNTPFFAYYPMMLTHDPYEPTPHSAEQGNKDKKYFKDMVEYMDELVGRVVDHLEELKLRDNTIIIFVGDNGTGRKITTETKTGTVRGGKGLTTDAGMHVPMIVNWPGKVERNTVTDRLVDFSDFLPSLLAATGHDVPADFQTDGTPFLDANGISKQEREWLYCFYEPRHSVGAARNNAIFARDERYKLYSDKRFYDLSQSLLEGDEGRLGNMIPPAARRAKADLQKVIDRFAREGAALPDSTAGKAEGPRNRRARRNP